MRKLNKVEKFYLKLDRIICWIKRKEIPICTKLTKTN